MVVIKSPGRTEPADETEHDRIDKNSKEQKLRQDATKIEEIQQIDVDFRCLSNQSARTTVRTRTPEEQKAKRTDRPFKVNLNPAKLLQAYKLTTPPKLGGDTGESFPAYREQLLRNQIAMGATGTDVNKALHLPSMKTRLASLVFGLLTPVTSDYPMTTTARVKRRYL